jgi:hypothetical protein
MLGAMRRLLLPLAIVALAAGCGSAASTPKGDPGVFALKIMHLIVTNQYTTAWRDMHPDDQKAAPLSEYVACETRSPVLVKPTSVKVVGISDQSVGLGNGHFVDAKAVRVRIVFPGQENVLVHTVHIVAAKGRWTWILPPGRYAEYESDRCSTAPPPSPSASSASA